MIFALGLLVGVMVGGTLGFATFALFSINRGEE